MTNKPVAYMSYYIDEDGDKTTVWTSHKDAYIENQIPLYSQDYVNKLLGEIEALKDEVAEWKMSYENCHRMCSGYGMN